ncbi:LuxR C-terminal-related transcriptional regulator [Streptomyces sp. NPDC056716]|uniref:LuxR C-terminal-related transcriptional regulator n=1 Tax=unclassified Streptomyces TaxID=2593676 RepID=UPI0036765648
MTRVGEDRGPAPGRALTECLVALLARRPGPAPSTVAEAVRQVCAVDHVALVEIGPEECTVMAVAGPDLLTVGTSSPPTVSTRLLAVAQGRVWFSSDMSREEGFDRPIDQLHSALGIKAGAGVPLRVGGRPAAAVLLSCTAPGRDWGPAVAGIEEAAGLLLTALGFGRGEDDVLRVVVMYPDDQLIAHGLARIVERGLAAEVDVIAGPWVPRLAELVAKADVVVTDSAADWAGDTGRLVVVHDGPGPAPASGTVVSRDAAAMSLVAAVAHTSSVAGPQRPAPVATGLSPREVELLRELAGGRSYKEIAGRLRLSTATLRGYSRGLYAKLGVHSRAEAVAKATQSGF